MFYLLLHFKKFANFICKYYRVKLTFGNVVNILHYLEIFEDISRLKMHRNDIVDVPCIDSIFFTDI